MKALGQEARLRAAGPSIFDEADLLTGPCRSPASPQHHLPQQRAASSFLIASAGDTERPMLGDITSWPLS